MVMMQELYNGFLKIRVFADSLDMLHKSGS